MNLYSVFKADERYSRNKLCHFLLIHLSINLCWGLITFYPKWMSLIVPERSKFQNYLFFNYVNSNVKIVKSEKENVRIKIINVTRNNSKEVEKIL